MNCLECGACCKAGLLVEVIDGLDEIPENLIEPSSIDGDTVNAMRQNEEGVCIAYNLENNSCNIYKQRPIVCRNFTVGEANCKIARRLQNIPEETS
jgi:Fe-S-cluster containining protein